MCFSWGLFLFNNLLLKQEGPEGPGSLTWEW